MRRRQRVDGQGIGGDHAVATPAGCIAGTAAGIVGAASGPRRCRSGGAERGRAMGRWLGCVGGGSGRAAGARRRGAGAEPEVAGASASSFIEHLGVQAEPVVVLVVRLALCKQL